MALDLGSIVYSLKIDTSKLNLAKKHVDTFQRDASKSLSSLENAAKRAQQALLGVVTFQMVKSTLMLADNYKLMQDRLIGLTGDATLAANVLEHIKNIAKGTGTAVTDVASGFQKISYAKDALGASDSEIMKVTQAFFKLGMISGTSAHKMNDAVLQFSQGLVGGKFQAQELQSVFEAMPVTLRYLAQGMGITESALIEMKKEGNVISKEVFQGMLNQVEAINAAAEGMPGRLGRSFGSLKIGFTDAVVGLDDMFGITAKIAKLFSAMGDSLSNINNKLAYIKTLNLGPLFSVFKDVATYLTIIGASVGLVKLAKLPGVINGVAKAMRAITILGNPWVLAGMGVLFVLDKTVGLKNILVSVGKIVAKVGNLMLEIFSDVSYVIGGLWDAFSLLMKHWWEDISMFFKKLKDSSPVKFYVETEKTQKERLAALAKEEAAIAANRIKELDKFYKNRDALAGKHKFFWEDDPKTGAKGTPVLPPLSDEKGPGQGGQGVSSNKVKAVAESTQPFLGQLGFYDQKWAFFETDIVKTKSYYEQLREVEMQGLRALNAERISSEENSNRKRTYLAQKWYDFKDTYEKNMIKNSVSSRKEDLDNAHRSFSEMFQATAEHNRGMFMLNKASVIANMFLTASKTMADAYSAGNSIHPSLGRVYQGIAASAMYIQIQEASKVQYQPRAMGGEVGANKFYGINENGPELFNLGGKDFMFTGNNKGTVTPNSALGKGSGGYNVNVKIINIEGQTAQVKTTETDSGLDIELLIEKVENKIATGVVRGVSNISNALERTYNLNRAYGAA